MKYHVREVKILELFMLRFAQVLLNKRTRQNK